MIRAMATTPTPVRSRRSRRGAVSAALSFAVFGCALATQPVAAQSPRAARPATATRPAAPALAVIMAVDGLSTEQLLKYRPWYTAGLKRLLDEGHFELKNRYRHMNTETGPGHASLGTGAPPRVSGIVANTWVETDAAGALKEVYCTDSLHPDQATGRAIPSGDRLRIDSFGDRLVAAKPGARVVSISAKDRGAILMAGRNRYHAAYWFDRPSQTFTTSIAFSPPKDARDLVAAFNEKTMGTKNLEARFGPEWTRLAPPEGSAGWPQPAPPRQFADFQMPVNGLYFPHRYALNPRGMGEAYYSSPVVDDVLADLGVALLKDETIRLGRRGVTDLFAISFSAHDVVSHNYGNESEETLDVLRRLDVHVGRVLDALSTIPGGVLLGFSADHGFSTVPEFRRDRTAPAEGGRLVTSPRMLANFPDRMNRFVRDELCLSKSARPLSLGDGWNIAYAPGVRSVDGPCGPARDITKADLDRVVPKAAAVLFPEEIAEIRLISQKDSWPADLVTSFLVNDFVPGRSGDAFIVVRRRVIQHWDSGRGSGHGSIEDYDTDVPLIFWGAPFKAGTGEAADAAPYDLAATLAAASGVTLPDAVGKSRLPAVGVSATPAKK